MGLTKRHARDSRSRGVFITATDTGVGKTLVASALVACVIQRGIDVGVMKPIETGVSQSRKFQSDAEQLHSVAGSHDSMMEICPYAFQLPVAPLSAAEAEGMTIRTTTIMRAFHTLQQKHALMVVEGAGGIYTPITKTLRLLDLIYNMKLPAIVIGVSLKSTATTSYKDRSCARTVDRQSPTKACRGSRCRPAPLQHDCEPTCRWRLGTSRGDRSNQEVGEVGPSPHCL
jgi:dethiobiotin synthase